MRERHVCPLRVARVGLLAAGERALAGCGREFPRELLASGMRGHAPRKPMAAQGLARRSPETGFLMLWFPVGVSGASRPPLALQ